MKKEYIIIGVIIIAALAYYFGVYKKKDDLSTTSKAPDAFDLDDTTMYNQLIDIFKAESTLPSNLDWINPLVSKRFKADPVKTENGRASKAETFYAVVSAVNRNKDGKFPDESGAKALYPKSMRDTMWAAMSSFRIKYSGL